MGRGCQELLHPVRYGEPLGVDFLLARANLLWPQMGGEERGDETHLATGLLDLSQTPLARARLAMQAAAFLEGQVSSHVLTPASWAQEVVSLVRTSGAQYLDWVVAVPAPTTGLLACLKHTPGVGQEGLAGACFAVTDVPEMIDASRFDGVITSRAGVGIDAARVFRMVSALTASSTIACMDALDLVEVFNKGACTHLVDVFWDTRAEQLSFPSAQEQELLEKAQGAVLGPSSFRMELASNNR